MPSRVVTREDWENFQRWLRRTEKRRGAAHGMRERPRGLRSDHSHITSGAVEIGKDLHESVSRALAALVIRVGVEGNAGAFLSAWVGPFQKVTDDARALLRRERGTLQEFTVFGLWCDEDCGRFIRPFSLRLSQAPGAFHLSAVCARCRGVTVAWATERAICVRCAPELRGQNHPMSGFDLYEWVRTRRPPETHEAPVITLPSQ